MTRAADQKVAQIIPSLDEGEHSPRGTGDLGLRRTLVLKRGASLYRGHFSARGVSGLCLLTKTDRSRRASVSRAAELEREMDNELKHSMGNHHPELARR